MQQYLDLCNKIITEGEYRKDRTGTGTIAIFDAQLKFDLQDGFPLVTTKAVPFNLVASEWLWMVQGRSDLRFLLHHNNNIWNDWPFKKWVLSEEYDGVPIIDFDPTDCVYKHEMKRFKQLILDNDDFNEKYGDLGPVYGVQWRKWRNDSHHDYPAFIDQLGNAITTIKMKPHDRQSMLVSSWNPTDKPYQALPPCHYAFQFYVRRGKYLDLKFHQRSADVFLGLPFDIASYGIMVTAVAHITGLVPGRLTADLGDTHIYTNHLDQVDELLRRRPKQLPTLKIIETRTRMLNTLEDFRMDNLVLNDYDHHAAIKAPVSV